ncbi:MAG: nucleotide exchange factor GrpE [Chloroflexi bacterium]|nr:nucleotide exchange factor GrpE [Chloroflexota bacterium]
MSADNWLARLARRFGLTPIPANVAESLTELQTTVAALTQVQSQTQTTLKALQEAVEKLEKQQARAGKEQFKANALAETHLKNFKTALEQLREAESYRDRELERLREKLATTRDEGRLEIIKGVLPVLDGLDEAIASGERLMKNKAQIPGTAREQHANPKSQTSNSIRQRLRAAAKILFAPPAAEPAPIETLSPEAVAAWLQGLSFVQDRLLAVLAAEGVHPIETEAEPFDPHWHVAIETVAASDGVESGAIVRELRRGYALGETALRYAEVVVAREPEDNL